MIQNNNNEAAKLHFAVMTIGAAADLMGISPSEMHKRLDKVGLVKNLLFDLYDVEHTHSLEYVAEDVVDALHNWEKTDKSELIDVVNGTLFTEHHFTRVPHFHRFCKC